MRLTAPSIDIPKGWTVGAADFTPISETDIVVAGELICGPGG